MFKAITNSQNSCTFNQFSGSSMKCKLVLHSYINMRTNSKYFFSFPANVATHTWICTQSYLFHVEKIHIFFLSYKHSFKLLQYLERKSHSLLYATILLLYYGNYSKIYSLYLRRCIWRTHLSYNSFRDHVSAIIVNIFYLWWHLLCCNNTMFR